MTRMIRYIFCFALLCSTLALGVSAAYATIPKHRCPPGTVARYRFIKRREHHRIVKVRKRFCVHPSTRKMSRRPNGFLPPKGGEPGKPLMPPYKEIPGEPLEVPKRVTPPEEGGTVNNTTPRATTTTLIAAGEGCSHGQRGYKWEDTQGVHELTVRDTMCSYLLTPESVPSIAGTDETTIAPAPGVTLGSSGTLSFTGQGTIILLRMTYGEGEGQHWLCDASDESGAPAWILPLEETEPLAADWQATECGTAPLEATSTLHVAAPIGSEAPWLASSSASVSISFGVDPVSAVRLRGPA